MTDIATGPRPERMGGEPQSPPSALDDLIRVFHMHEDVYDEAAPAERRYWLVGRLIRLQLILGHSPYVDELIEALLEVDRGTLLPLFEPILNGRPKMRLTEQELQSRAALAMEALMLGGMTKDQAARKVASALGYASYDPIGRGKVAQWRDDLARAARGTGNYSEDYRKLASLHLEDRDRLRRAVKLHLQDPMNLAAQELKRVDWLQRVLD
jgi:hypothetical protein